MRMKFISSPRRSFRSRTGPLGVSFAMTRLDTQRIVEALSPLLGHTGPSTGLDGRSGAAGAAAAWRRIMIALAEESPTVLVLEDLQRADDALLDAV